MRLEKVSDEQLLDDTKILVAQERKLLTQVLYHLLEIERRRLFSSLKCSSLFVYCMTVLKYSEAQALFIEFTPSF